VTIGTAVGDLSAARARLVRAIRRRGRSDDAALLARAARCVVCDWPRAEVVSGRVLARSGGRATVEFHVGLKGGDRWGRTIRVRTTVAER
jgi:hypothetical protein